MTKSPELHVAVGVVRNVAGEVLIARRHDHLHQGGLWEFPGGKVEPGETVAAALDRELREELGIGVVSAQPLLQVRHDYADRVVLLDTWEVHEYSGIPAGREGQPIAWVAAEQLQGYSFPAANAPIITATRLPERYAILNDPSEADLPDRLHRMRAAGIRLVQLRAKSLEPEVLRRLGTLAARACRSLDLVLLLNAEPALAQECGARGVHLDANRLRRLSERPLGRDCWVAASCHDMAELKKAEALGLDFAVLSPVCRTASHPGVAPLGWERFRALAVAVNMPVYALGGMSLDCLPKARQNGARGIAGIRGILQ